MSMIDNIRSMIADLQNQNVQGPYKIRLTWKTASELTEELSSERIVLVSNSTVIEIVSSDNDKVEVDTSRFEKWRLHWNFITSADNLPEWARWYAIGQDGKEWVFENKPTIDFNTKFYKSNGSSMVIGERNKPHKWITTKCRIERV